MIDRSRGGGDNGIGRRGAVWRTLVVALIAVLVLVGASVVVISRSGGGAVEHVDPAIIRPPEKPNWALAWPAGSETVQHKTMETPLWDLTPPELIGRFEAVALTEPRVERIDDGAGDPLWRSYRQRSRIFRFPDLISVRAVEVQTPDGPRASLIVYSRSVYGYSDLGVNGARVARWLAALEKAIWAEK